MQNRLVLVIFGICVIMGGLLVLIGFAEQVPGAGGVPHASIPAMQVGNDGAARLEHIGSYAFIFQALLLLLIICLCTLGIPKKNRSNTLYLYMTASYAFSLLVWWQMYFGHQEYLATKETAFFMGFPIATAWQMYGTWLSAIPLILIYTLGFNKFIYTKDDAEAFEKLLAEKTDSAKS